MNELQAAKPSNMRASIEVWVTVLLMLGALSNETLAKVAQQPTVEGALDRRPASDDETEARGEELGDKRADAADATGEPAVGDLDDADDETSAPGEGSRSVGGVDAGSPPNWLAGSWFQKVPTAPNTNQNSAAPRNNLFGGFMVRLNDHHVLTHENTCRDPQDEFGTLDTYSKNRAHEQVSLSLQPKINVKTGPAGTERLFGCHGGNHIALGNGMGVYKLTHEKDWDSRFKMLGSGALKTTPPLQHDTNVQNDCHLHSYSGSSNPAASKSGAERQFTKFGVKLGGCSGSICNFSSERVGPHGSIKAGAVCPDYHDSAAPIMCGADKKLSFLTIPNHGKGACGDPFSALRIADHHFTLSGYFNTTNTMPKPPINVEMNHKITNPFEIKKP